MTVPHPSSSCERLESPENLAFQRHSWRWEAAGRWLIGLLVAAAVAGAFGGGPLSRGEAATADGAMRVDYERIARADSPHRITVHLARSAVVEGQVELWVDAALLEALDVESVAPEPVEAALDSNRLVYRFRVASAETLAPIIFHVKTDGLGHHAGRIGLRNGSAVTLGLWIHP